MLTFGLDMIRWLYLQTCRVLPGSHEGEAPAAQPGPGDDMIFRMRSWPQLPEDGRTAEVYRMLSVMSQQPVNRRWLLSRCRMAPQQLEALLQQLVAQGSIEVIDPARFARNESLQA